MADASCSGGTPFKRLIEHQNRDVSHHQDRLVGNPASQQGSFRSAPSHQQVQNGFNAFMDTNAGIPGMSLQQPGMGLQHHAAGRLNAHAAALEPVHPVSHQAPAASLNNWAADFARFSSPQQAQLNHQRSQNFQAPQLNSQRSQNFQMSQQPQVNFHAAFAQPNAGFSPLYGPTNGGFMDANAASAQRPAAEADFDEEMSRWMATNGAVQSKAMEDVDAVMDQMARELELNDPVLDEAIVAKAENAHFTDLESPELGNLSRTETPVELPINQRSEVSEAAERLLESVQHEEGDKWKNSVFLSLMRDFRDGRKDIIDNEVRETDIVASEGSSAAAPIS